MSGAHAVAAGRTVTSAQPYAWPFHGLLDPGRCALVACLDPAWRVAGGEADAADELLSALAGCLRSAGGRVIAVTRLPARRLAAPDRPPLHSAAGAGDGEAWRPAALHGDLEVRASATSAFHGSPLDSLLREIGSSDLLVAGWGLEGPVHSTLRAANDRGYECLLVPDACTTLQPELGFSACEMVRFSGGIFGAFADAADVIDALAATAEGATTNRSI